MVPFFAEHTDTGRVQRQQGAARDQGGQRHRAPGAQPATTRDARADGGQQREPLGAAAREVDQQVDARVTQQRTLAHQRGEEGAQRAFGELFKWHMLEEIEHRNVAFDLYQHLYGGYLFRVRLCWFAQGHMLRFQRDCAALMSTADVARHGERCRIGTRQQLQLWMFPLGMRLRSMLPGYTPHRHRIPPGIPQLSEHFTRQAQSVR